MDINEGTDQSLTVRWIKIIEWFDMWEGWEWPEHICVIIIHTYLAFVRCHWAILMKWSVCRSKSSLLPHNPLLSVSCCCFCCVETVSVNPDNAVHTERHTGLILTRSVDQTNNSHVEGTSGKFAGLFFFPSTDRLFVCIQRRLTFTVRTHRTETDIEHK